MTTFAEKAKEMLTGSGMSEENANEVLAEIKVHKANEPMKDRWNEDVSGYPEGMVNILWSVVKMCALEFIDKNQPEAWYRDCFVKG